MFSLFWRDGDVGFNPSCFVQAEVQQQLAHPEHSIAHCAVAATSLLLRLAQASGTQKLRCLKCKHDGDIISAELF